MTAVAESYRSRHARTARHDTALDATPRRVLTKHRRTERKRPTLAQVEHGAMVGEDVIAENRPAPGRPGEYVAVRKRTRR